MTEPRTFMRLPHVIQATGRSRTSIYDGIKEGTFPAPIPIGPRAVAWDAEAIAQWQQRCMAKVQPLNELQTV